MDNDQILDLIKNPKEKKFYSHFDLPISVAKSIEKISDPDFVSSYSFFPLIERPMRRIKHNEDGEIKDPRPIRYAAHLDRCIYQYYSALLNLRYNKIVEELGIDESAIAYRTNKPGQSNCQFAQRAFNKIRSFDHCYVCTGDFRSFFETLNHKYLKKQLKRLFDDSKIPDDYYRVFKSSTQYSCWKIEDLLWLYHLPFSRTGISRLNRKPRVLSPNKFRQMASEYVFHPWKDELGGDHRGIPQGLPVSGVLANIYMIEFDQIVQDLMAKVDGLYMRYSDDFIFIVPTESAFEEAKQTIRKALEKVPQLEIHPEKTKYFECRNDTVYQLESCGRCSNPKMIDYLGFTYNGHSVHLRQRTIAGYYRRAYRRIRKMHDGAIWTTKKHITEFYLDFSDWGKYPYRNNRIKAKSNRKKAHGNFLTYADRAAKAFPDDPILRDVKNHKRKFRKRFNK